MLARKKEIDDVWQIVSKHQGLGHAGKVKEYTDLALALERDLKKRDTGYQYSFEKKEQEDTLKLGRGEIEELMKLSPEEIQQDIPRMEALIQGWKDMSDTEESYAIDVGSPRGRPGTHKVVKIVHRNISAKQLSQEGKRLNEDLINYA